MAGKGKFYFFHGRFNKKAAAVERERNRSGSFVIPCTGKFCVVTPRKK